MNADEREAAALHLWDEGLVRPESAAFAVIDGLIEGGYLAAAGGVSPTAPDEREALAEVIARTMPGWNEDTSEVLHPGWSETYRRHAELHWIRINDECLRQGRVYADAILAAGFRRSREATTEPQPVTDAAQAARTILARADDWARPFVPTEATELLDAVSTALERLLKAVDTDPHVCEECPTCGVHDGRHDKCCGCYDGVCCQENPAEAVEASRSPKPTERSKP